MDGDGGERETGSDASKVDDAKARQRARLAAALRSNLGRRKAQSRARRNADGERILPPSDPE